MSNAIINQFDGFNYTQIKPQSYYSDNSNYSNSCGNADTLDGYHANSFLNESSLIPLPFLTQNIAKVNNISFVQNYNEVALTNYHFRTFGIGKFLGFSPVIGSNKIEAKFKRIQLFPYSTSISTRFSRTIYESNNEVMGETDSQFLDILKTVNDGEEFSIYFNPSESSGFVLATWPKVYLTVTYWSDTEYLIQNQTCYSSKGVTENVSGTSYLIQNDPFNQKENTYVTSNQKFVASNNLINLLFDS